ncbi:MAG: S41 family peptidase [Erythrobacter sp.]|uniref:S41 family peptidase n=1 Tax=Erythrobacter sp. TaxID=1042 RepID=UPI002605BA7F|nr:S41 family peptidase [Erythrobacter sp.]MDJ0979437.1 S41 family peptidase [Erythrobacter sp.]
MPTVRKRVGAMAALLLVAAHPATAEPAQPTQTSPTFNADQVREDLEAWLEWTRSTHPDLSYSVNPATIDDTAKRVSQTLPETLTRAEAWKAMARLNPLFNDAHVGLLVPPAADVGADALAVAVSANGDTLEIAPNGDTRGAAARIVAFNGVPWSDLAQEAMELLRGENDALRRFIIERRLHGLLRLLLPEGEVTRMTLQTAPTSRIELPIDPSRIRFTPTGASDYALSFEGDTATLFIPSFSRDREREFAAFLEQAFASIAERESERLVIDISQNGGGAHELSDRLMAYLTDEPFASTSAISARVTPENMAMIPGAALGDVVTVPFSEPVSPPEVLPNRFAGEVAIKLGAKTYSQAIVFAATAQDAGLAQLIGASPNAPANQTGQVQTLTLPNTGFKVRAPIYIIYRGSGDRSRDPLKTSAPRAP